METSSTFHLFLQTNGESDKCGQLVNLKGKAASNNLLPDDRIVCEANYFSSNDEVILIIIASS